MIHTVGPVWRGGDQGEPGKLASCYRRSLELALAHGVRTIAFPAISCGIFGYPIEAATEIAVAEVAKVESRLEKVTFACFGRDVFEAYQRTLGLRG